MNHKSNVVIVWQGCDGKHLTKEFARKLKSKLKVKHYAISHWISESLSSFNIPHELLPISATKSDLTACENGDSIYFYYSDKSPESIEYYGAQHIEEIEKRIGLNVIQATLTTFNKEDLYNAYKKSFIGIRLTTYDGCPNTILEMGLMGRKTIFNGDLPHCIKWNNIDDIVESIKTEYENRHLPNQKIHEDFKEFLNIKLDFLEI